MLKRNDQCIPNPRKFDNSSYKGKLSFFNNCEQSRDKLNFTYYNVGSNINIIFFRYYYHFSLRWHCTRLHAMVCWLDRGSHPTQAGDFTSGWHDRKRNLHWIQEILQGTWLIAAISLLCYLEPALQTCNPSACKTIL